MRLAFASEQAVAKEQPGAYESASFLGTPRMHRKQFQDLLGVVQLQHALWSDPE